MIKSFPSKILVILENFEYGGTMTHLINLINSSKFKNKNFTIITNRNNKAKKQIIKYSKNKNMELIYYNSLNEIFFKNPLFKIIYNLLKPFLFLISIFQMISILKKLDFDLLLADCGGYGNFRTEVASIIAGKILKKTNMFLLIHHCYSKPFFWSKLVNYISSLVGKYLSGIIFVSKATKKSIYKNTKLLSYFGDYSAVIHNGIYLKKIKKKKLKIFNKSKKYLILGMLSRIEEYKGQLDLIEAFSKLPAKLQNKYKIFFIGNGKRSEIIKLDTKIKNYKLNKFCKRINYLQIDSLTILDNFDIFYSLTRDFEGFGYSIAESLYTSVPVVSTNVGGITEYLNNKNSTLVKPRDIAAITETLKNFVTKKKIFIEKSKNGKKMVIKKYNSDLMSEKYSKYFFKVINLSN